MSRSTVIGLGIVCIVLVAGLVGAMLYYNNYVANHHHTDSEYDAVTNYKNQLETWLAGNITQLQSSYNDYVSTHSHTNTEYTTLQDDYDNYVSDHHYTDEQYDSENASSYESGYNTGYNTGYTKGLNDGAGHGFTVRDPTYQEMLDFMASDQTDKNEYTTSYMCWNFAGDVKNNAFKVGYRCGFVYIDFPDSAHSLICFKTIDKGLVFIEPQDDAIVSVVIGQHYWDRTKYIISYDDTVVSFGIIW